VKNRLVKNTDFVHFNRHEHQNIVIEHTHNTELKISAVIQKNTKYLHLSYKLVGTWTVLIVKFTGKLLKFLFSIRRKSVILTFFDSEYLICSQK